MSWGDAVEVLEPQQLREVVATAVRHLAERYGE
jgi:predicted DNA-binding transcriptional regulator YafY